jgi:hypothetical protein
MEFANNTGSTTANIFASSSKINLQTTTTGTLVTRMSVDETSFIAEEPIESKQGIVGPTTAISYSTGYIGQVIRFDGPDLSFVSGTPRTTLCTTTIPIGVWLAQTTQIITRGTGTFGIFSSTTDFLSTTTGTATVRTTSNGGAATYLPIPDGYIGNYMHSTSNYVVVVTSAATFSDTSYTNVNTLGTATRQLKFMFTRIA